MPTPPRTRSRAYSLTNTRVWKIWHKHIFTYMYCICCRNIISWKWFLRTSCKRGFTTRFPVKRYLNALSNPKKDTTKQVTKVITIYCSPPVDVLICTNSPHSQSRRFIIVYDFLYIKDSTFRTPSVTGQDTSCTNGTTLFLVFCTYSTQLPIMGEIFIFRIENCSC